MRRFVAGFAASALVAVGAAGAADLSPTYKASPIAAPGYDWTGFYVGANFGYGWRDPSIDFSGNALAETTYFASGALPRSVVVDPKGFLGGLQGGYNQQFGRWVLGLEADLDLANLHDSATGSTGVSILANQPGCAATAPPTPCSFLLHQYGIAAEQKLDTFGTLRGRGGIVLGDRLLLFATGGLAFGEAKLAASVTNNSLSQITTLSGVVIAGPTPVNGSCRDVCAAGLASQWLLGWTVGGGFEYAIGDRWSLKGEYLYYDLGRMTATFADPHLSPYAFSASADYAGHIARVGVNLKLY